MWPISLRRRRRALLRLRSGLSAQARGVPGGCLLRGPWRRRSGLTRGARALLSRRIPLSAPLLHVRLLELLRVALLPLLRQERILLALVPLLKLLRVALLLLL